MLALLGFARLLAGLFRTLGMDIALHQAGGKAVLEEESLYYLRSGNMGLRFTYPPFAASAFVLLNPIPRKVLWLFSLLVNIVIVRFLVQVTCDHLRVSMNKRDVWLLVAAGYLLAPVAHTAELGAGKSPLCGADGRGHASCA